MPRLGFLKDEIAGFCSVGCGALSVQLPPTSNKKAQTTNKQQQKPKQKKAKRNHHCEDFSVNKSLPLADPKVCLP